MSTHSKIDSGKSKKVKSSYPGEQRLESERGRSSGEVIAVLCYNLLNWILNYTQVSLRKI